MLIKSQDRKTLVVMETVGQIYVDNTYSHKTPTIYCDFADGRTAKLGESASDHRCIEITESLCDSYQYAKEWSITGAGCNQAEFVFFMDGE